MLAANGFVYDTYYGIDALVDSLMNGPRTRRGYGWSKNVFWNSLLMQFDEQFSRQINREARASVAQLLFLSRSSA